MSVYGPVSPSTGGGGPTMGTGSAQNRHVGGGGPLSASWNFLPSHMLLPSPSSNLFERSMNALVSNFKGTIGYDSGFGEEPLDQAFLDEAVHTDLLGLMNVPLPEQTSYPQQHQQQQQPSPPSRQDSNAPSLFSPATESYLNLSADPLTPGGSLRPDIFGPSVQYDYAQQAHMQQQQQQQDQTDEMPLVDPAMLLPPQDYGLVEYRNPAFDYIVGSFLDTIESMTPASAFAYSGFGDIKPLTETQPNTNHKPLEYHPEMLLMDLESLPTDYGSVNPAHLTGFPSELDMAPTQLGNIYPQQMQPGYRDHHQDMSDLGHMQTRGPAPSQQPQPPHSQQQQTAKANGFAIPASVQPKPKNAVARTQSVHESLPGPSPGRLASTYRPPQASTKLSAPERQSSQNALVPTSIGTSGGQTAAAATSSQGATGATSAAAATKPPQSSHYVPATSSSYAHQQLPHHTAPHPQPHQRVLQSQQQQQQAPQQPPPPQQHMSSSSPARHGTPQPLAHPPVLRSHQPQQQQQPPPHMSFPVLPMLPFPLQMYPPNQAFPQMFTCTLPGCGKVFARYEGLAQHLAAQHATGAPGGMGDPYAQMGYGGQVQPQQGKAKPFRCEMCPQTFSRSHDLKRHYYIHTQEKPYRCKRCNKGFSRRDALRRHERSVREGKKVHCVGDGEVGTGETDSEDEEDRKDGMNSEGDKRSMRGGTTTPTPSAMLGHSTSDPGVESEQRSGMVEQKGVQLPPTAAPPDNVRGKEPVTGSAGQASSMVLNAAPPPPPPHVAQHSQPQPPPHPPQQQSQQLQQQQQQQQVVVPTQVST